MFRASRGVWYSKRYTAKEIRFETNTGPRRDHDIYSLNKTVVVYVPNNFEAKNRKDLVQSAFILFLCKKITI